MAEYLTLDRPYDLTQSVPVLSSATLTTGFDRQRPVLAAADYTGKTAFEVVLALDSAGAPGEIVFHSGALGAVLTHTPAFDMKQAWGTWLWCRCRYKTASNWTPWSTWRKFQLGWRPTKNYGWCTPGQPG